jgi:hypothetical protein
MRSSPKRSMTAWVPSGLASSTITSSQSGNVWPLTDPMASAMNRSLR